MVRLKFLYKGEWCVSGTMTLENARKIISGSVTYKDAKIVLDEPGWPEYK